MDIIKYSELNKVKKLLESNYININLLNLNLKKKMTNYFLLKFSINKKKLYIFRYFF